LKTAIDHKHQPGTARRSVNMKNFGGQRVATTKILEVSEMAAEKFHDILKEQGENDGMLRVMVMPGAGGSMQYVLSVEQEAGDDDFVIDTNTIQVLVDADSAPLLDGSQIDYVEGLMRSGFVISNPNFQSAGGCGCGAGGGGCGCGGGGGGGCGGGGGGGGGCGGGGGACGCGGH
jgi:iron-sulfur cluster assembly protein